MNGKSIDAAQTLHVNKSTSTHDTVNSSFFDDIMVKFEEIKIGDSVRVVGKDAFKGHIGIIEGIYTSQQNEQIFKIQLQTSGETIDRRRINLKRWHL
jgi:hypothetical protein